jgi:hypothetical protein
MPLHKTHMPKISKTCSENQRSSDSAGYHTPCSLIYKSQHDLKHQCPQRTPIIESPIMQSYQASVSEADDHSFTNAITPPHIRIFTEKKNWDLTDIGDLIRTSLLRNQTCHPTCAITLTWLPSLFQTRPSSQLHKRHILEFSRQQSRYLTDIQTQNM